MGAEDDRPSEIAHKDIRAGAVVMRDEIARPGPEDEIAIVRAEPAGRPADRAPLFDLAQCAASEPI